MLGSATAVADATKTSDGQEHTITIDIWTDGADAAGALLAQLRDALHDAESALTVAGQTVVLCRVDVQTLLPDPDTPGVTHGVLRLRVVTEPA